MINTINISLPSQLKNASEKLVKDGYYASFSDLVRTALRKLVTETNYDFLAKQAKKEFIQKQTITLKNPKDIKNYIDSIE